MKRYLLDLTHATLSDKFPPDCPLQLIVQDGEHSKDFDLVPEEMAKPWVKGYFEIAQAARKERSQTPIDLSLPIGFNHADLLPGATLTELP